MFGGVVSDAEGGIEDEGLGIEVSDGRLVGEVVVGAGGVEADLQLDVAAGQTPIQDLADVYADLRHYSKNMQRTSIHHPFFHLLLSSSFHFAIGFKHDYDVSRVCANINELP